MPHKILPTVPESLPGSGVGGLLSLPRPCVDGYAVVMTDLPHDINETEEMLLKYIRLTDLHRELSSLYRTKSRDRRTVARLWYLIDELEFEFKKNGVEL